ncbi:Xanthine dehydrogenase C subunit [Parasponia andersonii]|uniref:Xanthine dehydrogenase C subunit n=1 Tax=Parasponia andersonii TaxID=3476 RepID=A0A2P5ARI3_PARAD|nr:Xanthine dehydrogenase C subunit [Parasponia andersonii]
MLPLALLILLTNLLPLSSLAAISDSSSSYNSFLKCMQKQSQKNVSNVIYSQSNTSYTSVLRAYIRNARLNTSSTKKPLLIVTATSDSHVSATVICTKTLGMRLKTRSGGHDYAGLSYVCDVPFVILDMFRLRSIEVDAADQSAWVQAGATLGELYYSIWKSTNLLGFPDGICPTVGTGGHISGGGYGNMLRKHGLASDQVVDAKIVDAKGNILDRKSMGEDSFLGNPRRWGSEFWCRFVVQVAERCSNNRRRSFHANAPTTVVFYGKRSSITVKSTIVALYLGNAEELVSFFENDFPLLGLKKENCTELSWMGSVLWWNNVQNGTSPDVLLNRKPNSAVSGFRKSDYVQKPIPKSGLESLWMKMIGLVFNPYGGRMSEIPASDTPFPHRSGNLFKIQYSVSWSDSGAEAERDCVTKIRSLFSFMTPYVSENPRSAYLNYRDLDIGINHFGKNSYEEGKVYGVKYFSDNFDRLVKVKTAVDPENFFKNEQSIPILQRVLGKILA